MQEKLTLYALYDGIREHTAKAQRMQAEINSLERRQRYRTLNNVQRSYIERQIPHLKGLYAKELLQVAKLEQQKCFQEQRLWKPLPAERIPQLQIVKPEWTLIHRDGAYRCEVSADETTLRLTREGENPIAVSVLWNADDREDSFNRAVKAVVAADASIEATLAAGRVLPADEGRTTAYRVN